VLGDLSSFLAKGAEKKLDPETARLAPDMYPLTKQVQIATDHAKNTTAQLAGRAPPVFEDTEKTFPELQARIQKTIDYVKSVPASAFAGAEDRQIVLPLFDAVVLDVKGYQLVRDWALPHFYFHVVTAYDILRHNGVELGKPDYLSHVGSYIRRRGEPPGAQRTPQ
jgi:hypothetical protein